MKGRWRTGSLLLYKGSAGGAKVETYDFEDELLLLVLSGPSFFDIAFYNTLSTQRQVSYSQA